MHQNHAVLIVPGLGNSGPGHWQTLWENADPRFRRVVQRCWDEPDLDEWGDALDRAVRSSSAPCVLVAHSFGCLAVARREAKCRGGIAGALLVAPADPGRWGIVDGSIAAKPFDFPSIFVASETDPWLALDTARNLARRWGSRFVNIGAAGHINVEAGFGPWAQGERLLHELRCMVDPRLAPVAR